MTFNDAATMLVISQCETLRDEISSLFGEIRQTFAEIRADFQDAAMDLDAATERWISHPEKNRMPITFTEMEKPDLDGYSGFAR